MAKLSDKRGNRVFLSLGSNQGDRLENLKSAIELLKLRVGSIDLISHIYETEGWGNQHLLPFYNIVLEIFTNLNPKELLDNTQGIEVKLGRKCKTNLVYENREIDIDILWFNNEEIKRNDLVVPHAHMKNRRFVLEPFNEIARKLPVGKNGQTILDLYKMCDDSSKVLKVRLLN